jgi:hypothetical protein
MAFFLLCKGLGFRVNLFCCFFLLSFGTSKFNIHKLCE